MKKIITLIALLACCLPGFANASFITSGSIYEVGSGTTTIDYWYFSLESDDTVTINILGQNIDVNGDGTTTYLDSYIYLLTDDGSLDSSDSIAHDDDTTVSGDAASDGTVDSFDSYLSVSLSAGDYILAISSYYLSLDEVLSGFNYDEDINTYDYGDYQITWSDNVLITSKTTSPVPEPSSLAIFGMGLLSFGAWRRRYSKK